MSNRTEAKTKAPAADIKLSNVTQATDLETLRLPELQARYAAVLGETSKSPNRKFLIRRITETLAAQVQPVAEEEARVVPEPTEAPALKAPTVAPGEASAPATEEPAPEADAEPAAEVPNAHEAQPEGKCPTYGDECIGCVDCEPSEVQPAKAETKETAAPAAEPTKEKDSAPATLAAEGAPVDPGAPAADPSTEAKEKKPRGRFAAMSIADLQALYTEKVGRPTGSDHRGYLIWKIREAEKGRITLGPVQARTHTGEPREMKVLPLSLESTTVEKMDAAWRTKGIKTRAEFLRKAIGSYLTQLGATEEAALFEGE